MVKNKGPGKGVVRSAEATGPAPSAIRNRVGGLREGELDGPFGRVAGIVG